MTPPASLLLAVGVGNLGGENTMDVCIYQAFSILRVAGTDGELAAQRKKGQNANPIPESWLTFWGYHSGSNESRPFLVCSEKKTVIAKRKLRLPAKQNISG